jgi:hypothetical protein
MSSETSIDRDQFQPWHFFTFAGLAGATAIVLVSQNTSRAAVILLSLTALAAAFVGLMAWRTFGPLAGAFTRTGGEVLGGRTRAALERDKALVLRAIKDLEFDRAMGKVSEKDFTEMSVRLRARATGILRELDRGTGYRSAIEQEIAARVNAPPRLRPTCGCGTTNDPDARFCKNCGQQLPA